MTTLLTVLLLSLTPLLPPTNPLSPPTHVLLTATFPGPSASLPSLSKHLSTRPYMAVLPVQPMSVSPVPGGGFGCLISFRRKPTDAKGGFDGGVLVALERGDGVSATEEDGGDVTLTVSRVTEGQSVEKTFSEGRIVEFIREELLNIPEEFGRVAEIRVIRQQGPKN